MTAISRVESQIFRRLAANPAEDGTYRASLSEIAAGSSFKRRWIIYSLQSLVDRGLLEKVGSGRSVAYHFLVEVKISKTRVKIGALAECSNAPTITRNDLSRSSDFISNRNLKENNEIIDIFCDYDGAAIHHLKVVDSGKTDLGLISNPSRANNETSSSLRSSEVEERSSLRSDLLPPQREAPPPSTPSVELTDKLRRWAETEGVHPANVEGMFDRFATWHERKGTKPGRARDLAWLRWIEKAKEFEPELFAKAGPPPAFGTGKFSTRKTGATARPDLHKPDYSLEKIRKLASNPFGTGYFNPASVPVDEETRVARRGPSEKLDLSIDRQLERLKKIC